MKTKVFSLYDAKAKMFGVPFYMQTVGLAIRALQDLTNDKNTLVNRHPSDFTLYEIGEFDDSDAKTENLIPIHLIAIASEFAEQKPRIQITDIKDVTDEKKVEVK